MPQQTAKKFVTEETTRQDKQHKIKNNNKNKYDQN